MCLPTIDSLICLAVRAEAALDALDQPESEAPLLPAGAIAHRAFHAALSHLTIPRADRGLFHSHSSSRLRHFSMACRASIGVSLWGSSWRISLMTSSAGSAKSRS